jgi:hypothetical protein
MHKIRISGFFKNKLYIYLRTNKTFIHNSLRVFDNCGENLSYRKDAVQLQYEKVLVTWTAKPIRIIGGPDNQPPDYWSYNVFDLHYQTMASYDSFW